MPPAASQTACSCGCKPVAAHSVKSARRASRMPIPCGTNMINAAMARDRACGRPVCGLACDTSSGVRSSSVLTADWLHAAAVTPWAADDRPNREPSTYVRGNSNQINSSRALTPTVDAPGVAPAARACASCGSPCTERPVVCELMGLRAARVAADNVPTDRRGRAW